MTDALTTTTAEWVDDAPETAKLRAQLDEALILEHASGRAWRVCDSRVPVGSQDRCVGFVEERDGLYEVMQVTETFIWTTLGSMRAALDHLVATAELRTFASVEGAPTTIG
ncbi:hypothetical protein B7R21_18850 [Subtercola boreus]|uniref:Uncharacterized protein n=1 Tax=Subtercola boreus TaxID=120213 RepID=A0A3E0VAG7_9MICO|nr:hypothetical protein [Subtercola boreus]RFA06719.1 hypothetical protein B7R21_18850 [Subtercola boreus]